MTGGRAAAGHFIEGGSMPIPRNGREVRLTTLATCAG
jgi:hypothetical protein